MYNDQGGNISIFVGPLGLIMSLSLADLCG